MNVVTFYSFKGGVGRSLALANVAYELARSGNRVLVVDFDLEAPGLDSTFEPIASARTPGVVEYVEDYLGQAQPPDVRQYVYEWEVVDSPATPILVMPAGIPNESYPRRLSAINWLDLYERHQGYLMFEDLKAQWDERLDVDYVLVDSRTGHSDVVGICTRQLPDSLVILFFPNDQNLRGLTKVVRDVRTEPATVGKEHIELFFVASNLPRLDDEENILRRRMDLFRAKLETGNIGLVHRYDSLHLLEKPLFVRDRPHSRLARQFRMIAHNLRMVNVEDREGALGWLKHFESAREPILVEEAERRLSRIEAAHSTDGEVLYRLGNIRASLGQLQEAASHQIQAINTGFARPEVFLSLAETLQRLGDTEQAASIVTSVFSDSSTSVLILNRAVELLRLTQPKLLRGLVGSHAVNDLKLPERIAFAAKLDRAVQEREIAYELLVPLLQRATGAEEWFLDAHFALGSAAVALRRFSEAEVSFRAALSVRQSIASTFNLAIARWGLTASPDTKLFHRVIEMADSRPAIDNANYMQCLALCYHLVGQKERARNALAESRRKIQLRTGHEFSCWRFLGVSKDEFVKDLDAMDSWLRGAPVSPTFLLDAQQLALPNAD